MPGPIRDERTRSRPDEEFGAEATRLARDIPGARRRCRTGTGRGGGHARLSRDRGDRLTRSSASPKRARDTGDYGAAAGRGEPPSPPVNRASSRIGEGLKPLTII